MYNLQFHTVFVVIQDVVDSFKKQFWARLRGTDMLAEHTGVVVWLLLRQERKDGRGLGEALPGGVC